MSTRTSNGPAASRPPRNASRPDGDAAGTRRPTAYRSPGPRSWSPLQPGSTADPDEDRFWLEREISLIERALDDKGEMRRADLGDLVGCKYWGPRRFARALREGVNQGRISHSGFGRYGPVC